MLDLMQMKMMKSVVFNLLGIVVLFNVCACSKNGGGEKVPTKTELISSSTWKYSTAGIDFDNNGTSDFPVPADYIKPCTTDNTLTFKSDGTGSVSEGATKCDPLDPQNVPFGWSFKNNESDINFSTAIFAGISGDAKVIELTSTKLTMSKTIVLPISPLPVNVVLFLVH
jgi:hypothetical protein